MADCRERTQVVGNGVARGDRSIPPWSFRLYLFRAFRDHPLLLTQQLTLIFPQKTPNRWVSHFAGTVQNRTLS
jgi:hypothetical protein